MTGLRPIVEIMFMDFIGVCLDPIMNQAAKLPYMTAGALRCPVVFRTQTGAGRSAGAQHSQSLEAMFAHIPGLKVVMPATVTDAHDLMLEAVRDPNPVVFVENRRLYGMRGALDEDPLPLGRARVARAGDDVTVVTWGQTLHECLAAAEAGPASLEVIDLRSLVPLDLETVLESTRRTGRLLVVHEAVRDFGAGAEIAARVADELFDELRTPVRRIGAPPVPMPFNPDLERSLLPGAAAIARPPVPSGTRASLVAPVPSRWPTPPPPPAPPSPPLSSRCPSSTSPSGRRAPTSSSPASCATGSPPGRCGRATACPRRRRSPSRPA
jgi:pyruvate/2-oxoglutarate/acetoin dehydrogenase E1 component